MECIMEDVLLLKIIPYFSRIARIKKMDREILYGIIFHVYSLQNFRAEV